MRTITCYLDFISPYSYLAVETLPDALRGVSHRIVYRPVLFAGLLKHHGQLGPAEIDSKRAWTYRHVLWLARERGVPMDPPRSHPFDPLGLLRLAGACDRGEGLDREVCLSFLRHVWRGGEPADDAGRLRDLAARLSPARDPASPEVKAELRANTEEAIARGAFGVPSFVVDDRLFWGLDALPMLRAFLEGDPWFDGPWNDAAKVGQGVERRR